MMKEHTLEDKTLTSMEVLYRKLIIIVNKKFQRLRHVQPDLDIIFIKLIAQI